jgi:hypothetical protein
MSPAEKSAGTIIDHGWPGRQHHSHDREKPHPRGDKWGIIEGKRVSITGPRKIVTVSSNDLLGEV